MEERAKVLKGETSREQESGWRRVGAVTTVFLF